MSQALLGMTMWEAEQERQNFAKGATRLRESRGRGKPRRYKDHSGSLTTVRNFLWTWLLGAAGRGWVRDDNQDGQGKCRFLVAAHR